MAASIKFDPSTNITLLQCMMCSCDLEAVMSQELDPSPGTILLKYKVGEKVKIVKMSFTTSCQKAFQSQKQL